MDKPFFTAEDFGYIEDTGYDGLKKRSAVVADIANQLLREYIEQLPVVCGPDSDKYGGYHFCPPGCDENHSHKARLICIEPITEEGK